MRAAAFVLGGAALLGCSGPQRRVDPPAGPLPEAVAVLPFDNESVDLQGPELLRDLVDRSMTRAGYRTIPVARVDEVLRGLGITDGGQLGAVTPEEAGEALGVEGLVYGVLEEFAYQNLGVIRRRVVRLRLRFTAAPTGRTLWEGAGVGQESSVEVKKDRIGRAFFRGMAEKAAEKAAGRPLESESRQAVDKIFREFPRRDGP